jgi:hypothetical protein
MVIPRDIFPCAPINPLRHPVSVLSSIVLSVVLLAAMPARSQELPDMRSAIARAASAAHTMPPHRCVIDMHRSDGNNYWMPTLINGRLGGMFMLDTGFSGALVIPRSFLNDFLADGTITTLDQPGPKKRGILADGREVIQDSIVIRDFALPFCRAFSDVVARISDGGSPLIGQAILSLFRATSIDHENSLLVLDP